jgi:hypothetical protein
VSGEKQKPQDNSEPDEGKTDSAYQKIGEEEALTPVLWTPSKANPAT